MFNRHLIPIRFTCATEEFAVVLHRLTSTFSPGRMHTRRITDAGRQQENDAQRDSNTVCSSTYRQEIPSIRRTPPIASHNRAIARQSNGNTHGSNIDSTRRHASRSQFIRGSSVHTPSTARTITRGPSTVIIDPRRECPRSNRPTPITTAEELPRDTSLACVSLSEHSIARTLGDPGDGRCVGRKAVLSASGLCHRPKGGRTPPSHRRDRGDSRDE